MGLFGFGKNKEFEGATLMLVPYVCYSPCGNCGKDLTTQEGENWMWKIPHKNPKHYFCSQECAEEYRRNK